MTAQCSDFFWFSDLERSFLAMNLEATCEYKTEISMIEHV